MLYSNSFTFMFPNNTYAHKSPLGAFANGRPPEIPANVTYTTNNWVNYR